MAANHPQLGAALSNVAELNRVYLEHQREALREQEAEARRSSKSSRDPKPRRGGSASKKKSKDRKKDRKKGSRKYEGRRKDKKKRKDAKSRKASKSSRRASSRSRSDSSSGSDSGSDSDASSSSSSGARAPRGRHLQRDELARGRAATEAARHILAKFPDVRADLRGLLRTLDDGEAVAVDGIPDDRLRALIVHLFDTLGLRRGGAARAHILPEGAPKIVPRLALVFDETREQLAPFARARSPWRETERRTSGRGSETVRSGPTERSEDVLEGRTVTGDEARAILETADEKVIDAEPVAEPVVAEPAVAQPVVAEPAVAEPVVAEPAGPAPRPRVLGPAAPPPEFLAAAAAEFADAAVGPAPPEVVEEVELVGAAARSAAAAKTVAVASDPSKDAYDVLGAAPGDAPAAIKRAFWKLSLMVHPDKCDHPEAARAFDLAKRAHATLADAAKRAAIDDAREARDAREGFDEWLAEERKKAEWRALQGTPAEGDEAILRGGNGGDGGDGASAAESREEWMTRLPEQRKPTPGGAPSRGNARSFATTEFVERDARTVAEWTDAPKDAATREARLLAAARERALALPGAAAAAEAAKEARELVDAFNEKRRPKTLLEQHRERAERAAREKKKKDGGSKSKRKRGGEEGDGGDGTGWEYRPWNRETDLEAGRQSTAALDSEALMKKAGGDLKGRFGGGKSEMGERTFL